MFPIVDAVLGALGKVLDKAIPDANIREQVKAELMQEAFKLAQLEQADRDSARRREMALVGDRTASRLAWVYTLGYFGVLGVVMFYGVPAAQEKAFDILLGVLSAAQLGIIGYYFGASAAGDKNVTQIIKNGNGKH